MVYEELEFLGVIGLDVAVEEDFEVHLLIPLKPASVLLQAEGVNARVVDPPLDRLFLGVLDLQTSVLRVRLQVLFDDDLPEV